jgi:hypothetical protein
MLSNNSPLFQIAVLADALTKEDYETPNLPPNTVPGPTPIVIQAELKENDNHGFNAVRYNIMYYHIAFTNI